MKRILLVILLFSMFIGSTYAETSTDLTDIEGHWGETFIEDLVETGIISGYPDKTYRPNNTIQVDEFVTLCVKSLGVNLSSDYVDYWAEPYIDYAVENGLFNDGLGVLFEQVENNYKRPITREEMMAIALNTLNKKEFSSTIDARAAISVVTDFHTINDSMVDQVLRSLATGLITGYPDGSFKPQGTANRAECAVILTRVINPESRSYLDFGLDSFMAPYWDNLEIEGEQKYLKVYSPLDADGNEHNDIVEMFNVGKNIITSFTSESETNYEFDNDEYQVRSKFNTLTLKYNLDFGYKYDTAYMSDLFISANNFIFENKEYPYTIHAYNTDYAYLMNTYGDYMEPMFEYLFGDDVLLFTDEYKKAFQSFHTNTYSYDNQMNIEFNAGGRKVQITSLGRDITVNVGVR